MSETSDPENRTEPASPKRLADAYREGRVPLGKDAVQWAAMAAMAVSLMALGPGMGRSALAWVRISVGPGLSAHAWDSGPALQLLGGVALVLVAGALAALLATFSQTRAGFWFERVFPDAQRLWNGQRLSLFRSDLWTELGLSAAKVVAMVAVAGWGLRDDFMTLRLWLDAPMARGLEEALAVPSRLLRDLLSVLALLAGAELAITRWKFHRELRMTKEEARLEHKQEEGDPLIRSRRRRRHRELLKGRPEVEVPRADALVVNPTHIAIALRYRKEEGAAPKVLSKGKGELAERMRELARINGVPIVQDVALARLLYKKVKVGGAIPAATYRAVAAILAYVYRLKLSGGAAEGVRR